MSYHSVGRVPAHAPAPRTVGHVMPLGRLRAMRVVGNGAGRSPVLLGSYETAPQRQLAAPAVLGDSGDGLGGIYGVL